MTTIQKNQQDITQEIYRMQRLMRKHGAIHTKDSQFLLTSWQKILHLLNQMDEIENSDSNYVSKRLQMAWKIRGIHKIQNDPEFKRTVEAFDQAVLNLPLSEKLR